jgi:hypothetical protein
LQETTAMKLLVVLAVVLGVATAAVFKTPLKHIESPRTRMIRAGTWQQYFKGKESRRLHKTRSHNGNLAVVSQPVNDYEDIEYVGNVTVGNPQQQFQVILDTGSSNFWIPDLTCTGDACDDFCADLGAFCSFFCDPGCCGGGTGPDPCNGKNKFDSNQSTTYEAQPGDWQIAYGTGDASGYWGMDTVAFGSTGTSQLVVPRTMVGLATNIAYFFADEPIDGILGLAFQSIAQPSTIPPPLINAINQGLLDQPIFTVWLARRGSGDNVQGGGVHTYGGLDDANCGPVIAYQPLSQATYFQFRMAQVGLGSYSSSAGWEVISDTGTSFIGGPQTPVDSLARQAGAVYDNNEGVYYIPCDANPGPVSLMIGSQLYFIQPTNYILDIPGDSRCYFAFFPFSFGGGGPAWILGDPFIRQYCNVYDLGNRQIGFATSKQTKH